MAKSQDTNLKPETVVQFTKDIERLLGEMESKKGEYMSWCKKHRELINGYYDRASDAGMPKKALKAVIKTRVLEGKIENLQADLEEDELTESYETIRSALGDLADTPLGKAATGEQSEEERDLRPRHLRNKDVGEENAAKVAKGIKGLPGADAVHA